MAYTIRIDHCLYINGAYRCILEKIGRYDTFEQAHQRTITLANEMAKEHVYPRVYIFASVVRLCTGKCHPCKDLAVQEEYYDFVIEDY